MPRSAALSASAWLRRERTSIPGLYAVGNSAGGIFFHNYAGGAQLGAATVFGRIAGNEIAARAKAQKN